MPFEHIHTEPNSRNYLRADDSDQHESRSCFPNHSKDSHSKTVPSASIVVPCYNEVHSIAPILERLREALATYESYELIVVDDGSTDESTRILKQIADSDADLLVLRHSENCGYGSALKTGIQRARGNLIVTVDADMTYPIEKIPDLLALAAEYDMVVGARVGDNVTYPLLRRIPKFFLRTYASWIAGVYLPDMNSGLRVFHRDVAVRFIPLLSDGFSFSTTSTLAFLTNGYRVHFVPIDYSPRVGRSKIRPIRDTLKFIQLIMRIGMYYAPLRVFGPIILVMLIATVAALSYDFFVLNNLTDKSLILMTFTMNVSFFALLADMLDKRTSRF